MPKIVLDRNWVCNGGELKPKHNANMQNTWLFNGRELKPKFNANMQNTWLFDGRELKPKFNANMQNTWIVDGQKSNLNLMQTWPTLTRLTASRYWLCSVN